MTLQQCPGSSPSSRRMGDEGAKLLQPRSHNHEAKGTAELLSSYLV